MAHAINRIVHAVIPVKRLDQAKSRLRPLLLPDERQQLVVAMLRDVLAALQAVNTVAAISLVSNDQAIQQIARESASGWIHTDATLNTALQQAADQVRQHGVQPLIIFADLPLVTASEIDTLLAQPDAAVVLAAAHDGGTNALLADARLPLSFGHNSLASHQRTASELGLSTAVIRLPGLESDIDEPNDLLWLAQQPKQTASVMLLRSLHVSERSAAVPML